MKRKQTKTIILLAVLMGAFIALCASIGYTQAPVVTQPGMGFWAPTLDREEAALSAAGTANVAICKLFYLSFTRTVTQGRFYVASGSASSTADAALYNQAGNLIANLGTISTATGGNAGGTITQTSVIVQGGNMYWSCFVDSSSTPAITGTVAGVGLEAIANAGAMTTGTASTTIPLPSTLPTLTALNTSTPIPTIWWY